MSHNPYLPQDEVPRELQEIARRGQQIEGELLRLLLRHRNCLPDLALNPELSQESLELLVTHVIRESARDGRWGTRHESYLALEYLAESGRLAKFPCACRSLISRIQRPTSYIQSFNPHPRHSFNTLLAMKEIPIEIAVELDRQLVACSHIYAHVRVRLARHPTAGVEIWREMLRLRRTPALVQTIWENCGEIRDRSLKRALLLQEDLEEDGDL